LEPGTTPRKLPRRPQPISRRRRIALLLMQGDIGLALRIERALTSRGYAAARVTPGSDRARAGPRRIDAVLKSIGQPSDRRPARDADDFPTIAQVEWDHIQRALCHFEGNISAAARALKMPRRTLQRKLARPPGRGAPLIEI
jgi:two-component system response regulator RegA